jgi:hypothetical protein
LETIDISGTKMSLSVNGESVKSININNSGSTSSTIEITNCDSLVTLNKNYIKASSFTLACGSNENIGKNVTFS